jgi:hypothetical protein
LQKFNLKNISFLSKRSLREDFEEKASAFVP